jgi:hypothetical protein
VQRVSRSIRSSVVIPKPPMSPTSTSSQVLKSGLKVGVVIEAGLGAADALVVRAFLDLALVLDLDFVFALDLLLAFMVGSLGPLAGLMIANV